MLARMGRGDLRCRGWARVRLAREMDATTPDPTRGPIGKQRFEALTEGIYGIALTLLVLELKVPALPHAAGDAALLAALRELLPKALTWLLSFWVMAMFWLGQVRLYRVVEALDRQLAWTELVHLALISLLPFSTAVIGEYGNLSAGAALYSVHLLAIALVSAGRTLHLVRTTALHGAQWSEAVARYLVARAWVLLAATGLTLVLAFFFPGWNMFGMLLLAVTPALARR